MESLYPNTQHLLRVANENDLTEIKGSVDAASELEFYIYPILFIFCPSLGEV